MDDKTYEDSLAISSQWDWPNQLKNLTYLILHV